MNCQICGAELPSDALFCGECGSSTSATPQSRQRTDARPTDTTLIRPIRPQQTTGIVSVALDGTAVRPTDAGSKPVDAEPAGTAHAVPDSVGTGTAPSERRGAASGTSFVLQFSTGESFDVSGNGLVGRRPLPAAQESFDHLIQINDTGRSVSKTHLEFGQHDGELWVCDRDSGNGTIVRRADGAAIPCEPGRRYKVARGSRVEIGEQFFVVA